MKRILALAVLLLAGCQQVPAPVKKIETFTQADLANAITIATQAGPQGAEIVQCFTFLEAQLAALQLPGGTPPSGGTVGIATTFTLADLALANVASGSVNQGAFEMACGPLNIHLVNQGLSLSTQIANLAVFIAKPLPIP